MPDPSTDLVRVYTTALERREPPRLAVAKYFRITVTAAAGRIYRARKKGLLAPWKRRTTPAVVDEHTITGSVVVPPRRSRMPDVQPVERAALAKVFDTHFETVGGPLKVCQWCHGIHERNCPAVKRIRFSDSGERVIEVEYNTTFDDEHVIWPSDLESDD